jgi:hypothetical protein
MFNEKYTAPTTVKLVQSLTPHVYISADAINNMQLYVQGCADEIGWLGTAYKVGKDVHINNVYLFHQDVHSTTTEITPTGLATFGENILSNPDVDGMEIWNNLKMWGHSHVNMACMPSAQDDKQMVTFAESGHDWFVRLIANKKGDMRIDLYDYTIGVAYNDLPWTITPSAQEQEYINYISQLEKEIIRIKQEALATLKPSVDAEITAKVKKIVYNNYKPPVTTYYNQGTVTPRAAHEAYRQQQLALQDAEDDDEKKSNVTDLKKNSQNSASERIVGDEGLEYWIYLNFGTRDLDDLQEASTPEDLEQCMWEDYGVKCDAQTVENFFRFLSNRLVKQMTEYNEEDAFQGGKYSWES